MDAVVHVGVIQYFGSMGLYSQTLGDPDPRLPSGYEKKSMNTVRTELFYLRGRTKAHMLLMVISFLLHLEKSLSTHIGTFSIQLYISSTQPHIPTHSYISLHSSLSIALYTTLPI